MSMQFGQFEFAFLGVYVKLRWFYNDKDASYDAFLLSAGQCSHGVGRYDD